MLFVQRVQRVVNTEASTAAELLQSELEWNTTTDASSCGRLYIGLTVRRESATESHQSTTLTVRVLRADNLPPREFSGTCDPYVKVSYSFQMCLSKGKEENGYKLDFPSVNLSTYRRKGIFAYAGPTSWNSLPDNLKNVNLSPQTFKRHLKTFFFSSY